MLNIMHHQFFSKLPSIQKREEAENSQRFSSSLKLVSKSQAQGVFSGFKFFQTFHGILLNSGNSFLKINLLRIKITEPSNI
jgi:hypothetical protein